MARAGPAARNRRGRLKGAATAPPNVRDSLHSPSAHGARARKALADAAFASPSCARASPIAAASPVCLYGHPPADLVAPPPDAIQVSPLVPGSAALEEMEAASLAGGIMLAPPGTVERRFALAHLLRTLGPGAAFTVLAPKDRGGSRLGAELASFGCAMAETGRRHHRLLHGLRPREPVGLEAAIAAGAPRLSASLDLWTQPGVFSWDRPDPGTARLLDALPPLAGRGADLGCGLGVLARAVLASPAVTRLDLVDIDRRAVAAARRNLADPRAFAHWADARLEPRLTGLDFVVMNPPFHDGGREAHALGQAFIARAHGALRSGGALWLVANRHLPYEAGLSARFATVALRGEDRAYKVYEARK